MFKEIYNKLILYVKSKYKAYKNRWTLYLYFKNQLIKKMYVDDDYKPIEHLYDIKVRGFKRFFGTNRKIQTVVIPVKYKFSDNKKREVHIEVDLYKGVDVNV